MTNEDQTTVVFASGDGAEGWEDDLVAEGQNIGASVLRLPSERGVIPEGVGDGALLISVAAATRQAIRLMLFLLDRLRVGIVIDCRPENPVIMRNLELRRGDILVIDNEGSRLLRADDKGALAEPDLAALLRRLTRHPTDNT